MPKRKSISRDQYIMLGLAVLCVLLTGKIISDAIVKHELVADHRAKSLEIHATYIKLDSIQQIVDSKIATITRLGGKIDTLSRIRQSLQQEKELLQTRSRRELLALSDKVEGYSTLLLAKDEEIATLLRVNKVLVGENTDLKHTQNKLQRSISTLKKSKKALRAKVSLASQLKIGSTTVKGIGKRGRLLRKKRAKKIKALSVSFDIEPNEIAEAGGKEVLLRITAPDGKVLFDVHRGAGSFFFQGKEFFYTLKQDILYNKSSKTVRFLYEKQTKHIPGTYGIEVYTEGYLMGSDSFILK